MKRKQRFLAAFFRVVLCAGLFIGCKDLFYPEGPKEWTVTFDLDGGNIGGNKTPLKVSVRNKNSTGSATPANPTKDNFSFEGWYTEKNGGGSEFTSSTSVTENKTVYAKWTIKQVTITYNANGGTETIPSQTINSGTSATLASGNGLTRNGHTFSGWNTNASGTGTSYPAGTSHSFTASVILYAVWTPIPRTITFDGDGGSPTTQTRIVNSGSSFGVDAPLEPTKSGYAFDGWYTEGNGAGESFTSSTMVSANITVYAKWTLQWTVTFNLDGGNIGGDIAAQTRTVKDGASIGSNIPAEPTKSGYAFDGWYTEGNGTGEAFTSSTMINANRIVYAKWTAQWTITFNLDGGSIGGSTTAQTRTVNSGASLGSNTPSEPSKSGVAFGGWYTAQNGGGTQFTSSTLVTANITVYARWTITVTFNLNGGAIGDSTVAQTRTLNSGASLGGNMPAEPTKSGATFGGWYTAQNGGGEQFIATTTISANMTVYAKWTFTVTFNLNGGSIGGSTAEQTRIATDGSILGANIPAEPTKSGATFGGWYTAQNETQFTATTAISASMSVYAKWTITVTFNLDGGNISGSTEAQTRIVNNGASISSANMPSDPTKSGVVFSGWYTSQNGEGTQFTSSTLVTANITVYAKWTVTITFNLDGGNISGSTEAQTRTATDGTALGANTPANPTKSGATFGGWYTAQNGEGTQFITTTAISANMSVYAKWTVTVTFNLDGGAIGDSTVTQTRTLNSSASIGTNMPAEPTKSGYTFAGWYTAQNGGGEQFTSASPISANMTVYAKWNILSGNADLLSLTATSGKLNPTFSPQILQYSLTLLNSISNVTISAAKVDAKAEIDVPSQIIALNEGQSKTATIMITAENGNKQTYSVIVTREASVFYDGAEGSFDPKYTGRKNAQYTSNPGTPPPGTPSVNGAFVLTHYVPAPYAGSRSLLIGGGTPPLAVNIHERDVYIELNITLERKAEISFYYANSGGTSTLQGQFNLWGWALSTATFSVNGVKKQDFAAESSIPSWRRATVALDAGTNVLRWQKLYGIGGYTLTGAIIFQECLYLALDEIRIVYTE
jgi:uncharacterized repeat protein (TIGR02543 family)